VRYTYPGIVCWLSVTMHGGERSEVQWEGPAAMMQR
jgi:hypothetical protein